MQKSAWLSCLVACSLAVIAAACGDDDESGTGGSGGAGGSGAKGGSGSSTAGTKADSGVVSAPDDDNLDCPNVGPTDGQYVPKGKCCYRTSNIARIDSSADERVLEYRMNEFVLINHQRTIGELLKPVQLTRAEAEEQSLLFRFRLPQKDGELDGSKPGHIQVGTGRYNCDGTYSFYSKTAASSSGASGEADRWSTPEFEAVVKPDDTTADQVRPKYRTVLPIKNRAVYSPYLADGKLDWEGESQGFDILERPSGDEYLDCVGEYQAPSWKPAGKTVAFARLDLNNKDVIDQVATTFCGLMAFGAVFDASKPKVDCLTEPRCTPDEGDCKWQRLPDSLCPTSVDSKWACHLGYDGNPDNDPVKVNCTKSAPKDEDFDTDSPASDGQCCDPLGKGTDGLPACNAWLQINEFVAASAEITDEPANEIQQNCSASK